MPCWTDHLCLRAYLPWICTSLALGYAAYIHYKLIKLKKTKQINENKELALRHEVNIDKIDRNNVKENGYCRSNPVSEACCNDNNMKNNLEKQTISHPHPRTGFSLFLEECFENKQQNKVEFAKECAKRWKKLSPEEKTRYHRLAMDKSEEYENLESNIPSEDELLDEKADEIGEFFQQKEMPYQNEIAELENAHQENDILMLDDPQIALPLKRKRFSLKGDLDDLAFDIFCCDEMPIIQAQSKLWNRRISGELMLDELTKRWEDLPDDQREEYFAKAKKVSYCRCWKSKTFPLCDGAHKCHNKDNDDLVGPLNLVWDDSDQETVQTEPKTIDTGSLSSSGDQEKDMDIKSIDSESPKQSSVGGDSNGEFEQIPKQNEGANNSDEHMMSSLEMIDDSFPTLNESNIKGNNDDDDDNNKDQQQPSNKP